MFDTSARDSKSCLSICTSFGTECVYLVAQVIKVRIKIAGICEFEESFVRHLMKLCSLNVDLSSKQESMVFRVSLMHWSAENLSVWSLSRKYIWLMAGA